jgi:AcrR family transcriptional regulator
VRATPSTKPSTKLPAPRKRVLVVPGPVATAAGGVTSAAIRQAAVQLFAEFGYAQTTMKQLAEQVGIQPSGIYNHVQSKQVLLCEIVIGAIQGLIADAHEAIESAADVSAQLLRAVHGHASFHATHPLEMFICNGEIASLEEPARTRVVGYRQEYVGVFERLIRRGVVEGAFATPAPKLAAYAILQMGMGVSVWYSEGGQLSPTDVGDLYGEFALRLVAGPAA